MHASPAPRPLAAPSSAHADGAADAVASAFAAFAPSASTSALQRARLGARAVAPSAKTSRVAADEVFRAMCLARHALRRAERGEDDADDDDDEDSGDASRGDGTATWDGRVRGPARATRRRHERTQRFDFFHEVVPACEDGGELEMCTTNLGTDARACPKRARAARPLVVWAHGMRGGLENDEVEGLWNFWTREDLGPCAVARYSARGYGKSSDVRRAREARWDARASDMIEVARRIREEDGGDVVYAGTSLGGATAIWATVLAHESGGRDLPKAVVVVTPPTFYEEREARRKKLRKKVESGDAKANSTAPRRVFEAAREPVVPPPPSLANPNDSCAVEVLIGSAQSNLPEPERVRDAFANIPLLCLAWDCGDVTHPVSSAMIIKDLVPHAELVVASSKEDYDIVKEIRARWSGAIGEFIRRVTEGGCENQ